MHKVKNVVLTIHSLQ